MQSPDDAVRRDAERVRAEYDRRAHDEGLRRYYERVAGPLERSHDARRDALLAVCEEVASRQSLRVLDVGCGNGNDLAGLAERGVPDHGLFGVDLLADDVAAAARRLPGAGLAVANAARLPFADAAFDAVFQTTVLSSVLDAAVRRDIGAEMARVCRRGGRLVSYDLRATPRRKPHLVAVDHGELKRVFGPVGPLRTEPMTLSLTLASRAPGALAAMLDRVPALRTHLFCVVERH